jgi:hypothetical protein
LLCFKLVLVFRCGARGTSGGNLSGRRLLDFHKLGGASGNLLG